MNKKLTAFALCMALMTMAIEPASLAEEAASAPAETQTAAPQEPEEKNEQTPVSDEETTAEPTAVSTEEATPEPTAAPTEAAAAEPTAEPVLEPMTAKLEAAARYAVAGEKAIEAQLSIAGGAAPYAVRVCVILDGGIVHEENAALSEAGTLNIRYMPEVRGTHEVRVTVTDARENSAESAVSLPVSAVERETRADWEKSMADVQRSDDWRENIIAVAQSQLEYHESSRDFAIDDEGRKHGYTRYGDWYGRAYDDWCAMFGAFVLEYAGVPSYAVPRSAGSERWRNELSAQGAYEERSAYTPQGADVIFFDWADDSGVRDGRADHVGFVERVSGSTVYTIEGNAEGAVRRREYDLEDASILGYANLGVLMERAGLEEMQIQEETMDPVKGTTNAQRVNLRGSASKAGNVLLVLEESGTEVTVQARATRADGEIWYAVVADGQSGYIRADLLDLQTAAAVDVEWQAAENGVTLLCAQATENAAYRWQRRTTDENGNEAWIDAGEGALLNVPAERAALLSWYRCVRTEGGGETASEAIRPVRDEMIEWLEQGEPTAEMIIRALNASTLEAIMLESNQLIYVRTGEVIAQYDPETGIVTDAAMGVPVGRVVDGKLRSLNEDAADGQ